MNRHPDQISLSTQADGGSPFGLTNAQLATMPTVYRDDLLAGKVMLVSGGSSGIGKATAFLASKSSR